MKTTACIGMALLLTGLLTVSAGEVSKTTTAKANPAKVKLNTAGVPRTVKLDGRITDGPYQVVVVTEDAIRRSGMSTVSQVFNRYGR